MHIPSLQVNRQICNDYYEIFAFGLDLITFFYTIRAMYNPGLFLWSRLLPSKCQMQMLNTTFLLFSCDPLPGQGVGPGLLAHCCHPLAEKPHHSFPSPGFPGLSMSVTWQNHGNPEVKHMFTNLFCLFKACSPVRLPSRSQNKKSSLVRREISTKRSQLQFSFPLWLILWAKGPRSTYPSYHDLFQIYRVSFQTWRVW